MSVEWHKKNGLVDHKLNCRQEKAYDCKELERSELDDRTGHRIRMNCTKLGFEGFGEREGCLHHANHTLTLLNVTKDDISSYVCKIIIKDGLGGKTLTLEQSLITNEKHYGEENTGENNTALILVIVVIACIVLIAIICIAMKSRNSK